MNEIVTLHRPMAGVSRTPMVGLHPRDMVPVEINRPFFDLAPPAEGLLVLIVNGAVVSRLTLAQRLEISALEAMGRPSEEIAELHAQYAREALNWKLTCTRPNDLIEWHDRPQGREVIRVLLQVALLVASIYPPFAAAVPYLIAANAAYNLLVPPRQPNTEQEKAGGVYSVSLAGNAARLDQPIWRICGRVKVTPPFACSPYTRYIRDESEENPDLNFDEYYYALFAIGIGNYQIERAFIGKTPISHFQDVLVATYLAPGEQPSVVQANVISSDEVSAQLELTPQLYVGGYAACRPTDKVVTIEIDIGATNGLGRMSDNGNPQNIQVDWQVEAREINDFGTPIGDWTILANESESAHTNTPQRWTYTYTLVTPIRCEVRVVRTDERSDDTDARDSIYWIGMRAFLEREAPLNPNTAHYEVVMRANKQLSNFSQRDFSMIVRGYTRQWDPTTGWGGSGTGPEFFTRNAAWWLADLWTNPIWGEGLPDEMVDLQGLYEWSLTLDARQDHFDFSFNSTRNSWDAAQLIARSGRARAFRRNGVYTIARDEAIEIPRTVITTRNTQPKSMSLRATLPGREQPDSVIAEYLNYITWDTASVEEPCPGFTYSDATDPRYDPSLPQASNPLYIVLDGIVGPTHAKREATYQAYDMALRRTTVKAKMDLEAVTICYMDACRFQPRLQGYGQAGDVAFWDPATLVMGLSEPPDFTGAQPYLTLVRDDGSLTTPVAVSPGLNRWDVTLPEAPDFELVIDDGLRDRPRYVLGPVATGDELVKIARISDGGTTSEGGQLFDVEAVVDDGRVHTADNYLLPGPGDIQDPIDAGLDYTGGGGGIAVIVRLSDYAVISGGPGPSSYTLATDGRLGWEVGAGPDGNLTSDFEGGQWLNAPVEVAIAQRYEVYVEDFGGSVASVTNDGAGPVTFGGPAFNTWHQLGLTDLTWTLDDGPTGGTGGVDDVSVTAVLKVRIRRTADLTVLDTCKVALVITSGPFGGGGAVAYLG